MKAYARIQFHARKNGERHSGRRKPRYPESIFLVLVALATAQAADTPPGEMITVPAGAFTMGSNAGPEDERPAHEVTLATFSIDRFSVTNAEFADFLNTVSATPEKSARLYDFNDPDARIHRRGNRWMVDTDYDKHPVVEVPWAGAVEYCKWRGKRLPTEAEWEKAARGTDMRRYPWGKDLPARQRANYGAKYNETAPVDSTPGSASPYGVRDMVGNAWQWVSSAYRPYPYRADDGREDLKPGPVRSTRGGGHDSQEAEITTTQRGRNLSRNPASGHHNIGFRCAQSERPK